MSGGPAQFRNERLMRAYCEGVQASAGGAAITANPWDGAGVPEETAWDAGWTDHDGGAVDLSCCGYPVAGAPPPGTGTGAAARP